MSQVFGLFDLVRRHVRHVHGLVVLCPACVVSHGVLEHL
jgi:hypothetical protein